MTDRQHKTGVFESLLSGFFWAAYSVTLYSFLSPFNGDRGSVDSARGILLIVLSALIIAWLDALGTLCFELAACFRAGLGPEYRRLLRSDAFLKILPAAIFAGPLGLVPFAISSRYSLSVATSVSAFFPALAALLALVFFGERLSKLKFAGILIAVLGVAVTSGFANPHPAGVLLAVLAAAGYAAEMLFGYRLIAADVHPTAALALKQTAQVLLYTLLLAFFALIPGNLSFAGDFVRAIDFSRAHALADLLAGRPLWIVAAFLLASFFNAETYLFYYRGMRNAGLSTAGSLNITYGIWTLLLLALPPFSAPPAATGIAGALLIFGGSSLVIYDGSRQKPNTNKAP